MFKSADLVSLKQPTGTEIHHYLENSIGDPLKYTIGSPILIVSISMGIPLKYKELKVRKIPQLEL